MVLCKGVTNGQRCKKKALYAKKFKEDAKYCSEHGGKSYSVNVVSKRCAQKECMKQNPIFGPPGKKGIYCSDHKKADHIDVTNKKCKVDTCNKYPGFGKPGKKALYCAYHGKELGCIDVVSKLCRSIKCTKHPSYGEENGTPEYCAKHGRELGLINVVNKRCVEKDCMKQPSYGHIGLIPLYCHDHAYDKENLVNLVHKRCVSYACSFYENHNKPFATRINPKNNKVELCSFCWRVMYPDLSGYRKVSKEHFILAEVQRQIE